jgi:hypothetical protein
MIKGTASSKTRIHSQLLETLKHSKACQKTL